MTMLKSAVLSIALVSAGTIAAHAAVSMPVYRTYPLPPQVATNPGLPYAYSLQSGPATGAIKPSQPSASRFAGAGSRSGEGGFYANKGFGPAPN